MIIYSFKNDYAEGVHQDILKKIMETNNTQFDGYGKDILTEEAVSIIQKEIKNSDAAVHFVSGGTQANLIVISALLKPYESIIAVETGHIATSEAGAIERTGHKINTVKGKDGKLNIADMKSVLKNHTDEHMVKPKAVFISQSTELGTIYTKQELQEISSFCKQNNLFLYIDGARIGSAIMSTYNDTTLADMAELADVFYIGGTKNGALFGEAIVIVNEKVKENFRFYIKQHGALLAKGKMLAIQFIALFSNNVFFHLAQHANAMASKLAKGIENKGYQFFTRPITNQIFPILPNYVIEKLQIKYSFYIWNQYNESHTTIRLVTSWATKETMVNAFLKDLETL
jgi:threonine aldolase